MARELAEAANAGIAALDTGSRWQTGRLRLLARDPLVLFVLAFAAAALLIAPALFAGLFAFYAGSLLVAVPMLVIFIALGRAIITAPAAPLAPFVSFIVRLPGRFYLTAILAIVFLASFTTFKINIPAIMPFYADPAIAAIDRWIHGTDPWRLARAAPPATSLAVDFLYSQAWFGVALLSLLVVTLAGSAAEFRRFVWATVLIYVVLGTIFATALSSVGPVFYDRFYPGERFADLIAAVNADRYAVGQKLFMDYLYRNYISDTVAVGTGISAMPSVHVAIAVMTAWYATSLGRAWAIAGWIYAVLILFGSIYTAWHYAADGYFSAICATGIWLSLSRYHRAPVFRIRKPATEKAA